jgi:hypothetical protein
VTLVAENVTQNCYICKAAKNLSDFAKHPTGRFGVGTTCKKCRNVYRKEYYQKNKDKERLNSFEWSKNNLDKKRAYRAKRRSAILCATPVWAKDSEIKKIYAEANFLSKVTGIKYEVDHVIPLQGKNVCGLHVQNNLRVIKMIDNRKKAYKHES